MIERDLTTVEIEEVLRSQCYAHLGFINEHGEVSILPISYVYDDGVFYSFSTEGSKLASMRAHPHVCVQVEETSHTNTWMSVQVWGTFSETGNRDMTQFNTLVENFWRRSDAHNPIFTVFRDFLQNPSMHMTLYHITAKKMIGKKGGHAKERI